MENNDNQQPEQTSKQTQSTEANTVQQPSSDNQQPGNDKKHHAKRAGKIAGLVLLVVLLIAAAGGGAYWWRGSLAESREAELENKIGDLEVQIDRLEEESEEESEPEETAETDLPETIETAVSAGDYSDLEEHMSDTVLVVIAASDGNGEQEPDEAVQSLEYLDSASGSWDFDPSENELNSWRNDFYGQYFPTGAVVGRSSDDYVVSFNFDSSGDISAIFLAVNADLLTDQAD